MKAGSLPDDNAVSFARVHRRRHPQEKCASKCVSTPRGLPAREPRSSRYVSLCLHLFFNTMNLFLHVWLSSHPIADCQFPLRLNGDRSPRHEQIGNWQSAIENDLGM
jgi:hypothetical protein